MATEPVPVPAGECRGVSVTGLRRTFGDVVAVESVDMSAPAGQVTALVGPNGAGKTTLLLMLATLLAPDSGEMSVDGFSPVTDASQVRARIGWMPDFFGTYDTLTAREVLDFTGAAYRLPARMRRDRALSLLDLVHLGEYADRPVHVLSRGQKQRLGLARALVHDPSVLLLDEPAAGLDPRSRVELRRILRTLGADGRAVIVSSHVLAELESTSDRVVLIDRGRTVSQQEIDQVGRDQHRPWRIRATDTEQLLTALHRLGVEHRAPDLDGVELMVSGDEAAAELLASLVGAGVRVISSAPTGSSLESAYLTLTAADDGARR